MARLVPPILVLVLAGCGQDPYAAVLQERLQTQQETVRILRTVHNQPSMRAARDTLLENQRRYEETAGRVTTAHKPSGETLRRLEGEFGPKMQHVLQETLKELARIKKLPDGEEFLAALEKLKPTP